ncbi:MAG: thiamine pyrophosphate-dependent dehydrogenase E1 component subunit alpha [Calditrichaeota bacterium]|nr:thiamine pyrophosphate-dependent dehydrogenase E1 component subunit alpha [Calditrichota bacterium]
MATATKTKPAPAAASRIKPESNGGTDWRAEVLEQEKKRVPSLVLQQQHLEKMDSLLPELDIPVREYGDLKRDGYVELYRLLFLIREVEARLTRLYRQGKIVGGVYLSKGTEAIAIGSGFSLKRGTDWLFPMHRDLGAHLAFGQRPFKLYAQYMGRAEGPTKGRDGNTHMSDRHLQIIGMISHLGSMIPVAVGAAIGSRLQGKNAVALTYIGDGGASIGDFHEGLNYAAVANAPFVLIVENNQYAYSTPIIAQYGAARIIDRAPGYGIPGEIVDGNNVFAVYETCKAAVDRARNGGGPTLIEAVTMRMRGHSEHDDHFYVPKELLAKWAERDPLPRAQRFLEETGYLKEKARLELEAKTVEYIEAEIALAEQSPVPSTDDLEESAFYSTHKKWRTD